MYATKHLLSGIRVADFSRVLAGPYATSMLADQGAEVFKIEMPGHGDDSRHLGPFTESGSAYFTGLNRGKRSIEVDLKDHAQYANLLDFIATCDVVVENFRPGVAAKLGLSYADVKEIRPDIVYASISGFGQTGTQAERPAYDTVIQALSGLMSSTGFPGGTPTRVGESIADVSAGVFAAFGVSSALLHRELTGDGAHIDIPMLDVMLAMQPTNAAIHAAGGTPARVGNRHPVSAPSTPTPPPTASSSSPWPTTSSSPHSPTLLADPSSQAILASSPTDCAPTMTGSCGPRSRISPPPARSPSSAFSSTPPESPTPPSSISQRRSRAPSPTTASSRSPTTAPDTPI